MYSDGFFSVDGTHGFLPVEDPLKVLPERYASLQRFLDEMPMINRRNEPGYLAISGKIEQEVQKLPNYLKLVQDESDVQVLAALFRGYGFATSAYLLEPSHQEHLRSGKYGKGRTKLPANLAQPFDCVADKLGVYPWMDYSYTYGLGNFVRSNNRSLDYQNLDMAVSFSGGQNEIGFIMLHVDINQHSPQLIGSISETLDGLSVQDPSKVLSGLKNNHDAMCKINDRRKIMWRASDHRRYNDFRAFIMGIKGNDEIFGDTGVVYEGCANESTPRMYRGQTGAQDSIIPTADIFSGLDEFYPQNELTDYLIDLRQYRPRVFRQYLRDLKVTCNGIFKRLVALNDPQLLVWLLAIVEQIYHFRNGHWQFVQKYIMGNTKYAKATGGTPIIHWIPNQIDATLSYMDIIIKKIFKVKDLQDQLDGDTWNFLLTMVESFDHKVQLLRRQQKKLETGGISEEIYEINKDYKLEEMDD